MERRLKDLIRNCDDTIIPRLIYALPIGHSWTRSPGVTLLGDAAHVMSPYAGEGANLAMLDATELALAIAEHGDDVETALTQYEFAMFPRGKAAAENPLRASKCVSPRTLRKGLLEFFAAWESPGSTEETR